jgi:hypothetical protein
MILDSWKTHILIANASTNSETLQETSDCVMGLIANKLAYTINFLELRDIKPWLLNGEHLAMALRCTATRQKWITGWYVALDLARAVLIEEDKDPDDALFGMIDPPSQSASLTKTSTMLYYWRFTCTEEGTTTNPVVVVFTTNSPVKPAIVKTYQELLRRKKVPLQQFPLLIFSIEPIGWETTIPHLSES